MAYHHGDLRAAVLEAAITLIGEHGVAGLSVGEVARRVGVSSAAPYRHFANRTALLSAAATHVGRELHATLVEAMAEQDPVEQFRAAAAAYVRFSVERGTGFDLVWADELRDVEDADREGVTADLVGVLLWPAVDLTGGPESGQVFVRRFAAVVNGYASLHRSGFMAGHDVGVETLAGEAAEVVSVLATASRA